MLLAQHEELHGVELEHVVLRSALPGGERLLGEALGVGETPAAQRLRRAPDDDVPGETRQAQPSGERRVALEPVVGLDDAAELEQVGDAPGVRVRRELTVADALGERELLVGEHEPLRRLPGLPECEVTCAERRGEQRRIAERARVRERLLARREATRAVDEVDLARERRENERAQRDLVGSGAALRLLEERDHLVVGLSGLRARRAGERRGLCEALPVAGLARFVRRLDGGVARAVVVAGREPCLGEARQQVELDGGARARAARERQRLREVQGRVLVAQHAQRVLAGARRVPERAGGIGEDAGGAQVAHDVGGDLVERVRTQRLERVGEREVELAALVRRELRAQRLDDQVVREARGVEPGRRRLDDAGRERRTEAAQRGGRVDACGARDHRDLELRTLERRDAEQGERLLRRVADPAQRRVAQTGRQLDLLELEVVRVEAAFAPQHVDQLGDEERVARGRGVDALYDARRRTHAGGGVRVGVDVVGGEAAQRQALGEAREVGADARRVGHPFELVLAARRDQQQAVPADLRGEEAQQEQRLLVGPVQVVEHDGERLVGERDQQRADRVEQAEARGGRAGCRTGCCVGRRALRRELGQEARELESRSAERAAHALRVAVREQRTQRLDPRPEGRRAAALAATSPGDPRRAGRSDHLLDEARLADPRLAGDQHEASGAVARRRVVTRERRALGRAADERARLARRHGSFLCRQRGPSSNAARA
ncbi:MAG TPA: hypothetical protein VIS07_17470 [Candidatus Binatia bacterium]